jgi:hypothetical protein
MPPDPEKARDLISPNATQANQKRKSKPSQMPLDRKHKTQLSFPKCHSSKNQTRKQDAKNANGIKSKQQFKHPKKPPINVEITRPNDHVKTR